MAERAKKKSQFSNFNLVQKNYRFKYLHFLHMIIMYIAINSNCL